MDDLEMHREKVAEELRRKDADFRLHRQFGEEQAAFLIGVDPSWMKRHRHKKLERVIPHKRISERIIRYYGYQIVDILDGKRVSWVEIDEQGRSSLETSSLPSEKEAPPGIDAGERETVRNASHSARRILRKQSRA